MTEDKKRHKETAQRMPSGKRETWGERRVIRQDELYTVPSELIKEMLIYRTLYIISNMPGKKKTLWSDAKQKNQRSV